MNEKLPLSPDTHSLSRRWINPDYSLSLNLRWPFYRETKILGNETPFARRIAKRRGIIMQYGKWLSKSESARWLKERKEFMTTFAGTTVSDHDLPNYTIDLLWAILESADDDGNVQLSDEQRFNIEAVLKMVGIYEDGCMPCKGRGWFTQRSEDGWIVRECPFCGGHGRKMYKRDVKPAQLPLESEG